MLAARPGRHCPCRGPRAQGDRISAAEKIEDFHNLGLGIISAISVFVLALMLYVMVRFRESANPTPSRTVHNTLIEVLWTVIPILILVFIAVPSFRLLYFADRAPAEEVEMTIKAIGKQWYWSYEYPDHGNFTFDAIMVEEEELEPGQPRLLATDNAVVLPVDTTIRILVTAGDVLHNFAMPAFGIKLDGVPGRMLTATPPAFWKVHRSMMNCPPSMFGLPIWRWWRPPKSVRPEIFHRHTCVPEKMSFSWSF